VQAIWLRDAIRDSGPITAVYAGRATPEELAKLNVRGKLVVFNASVFEPAAAVNQRIAGIKAAGGRMAVELFTFDTVSSDTAAAPSSPVDTSASDDPGLPVMGVANATGDQFTAAVKAGPLPVTFVSRQFDQHRYELAHEVFGKVDTAQVYHPKTRDLVAVHARYYDNVSNVGHLVVALVQARPGLVDFVGEMTVQGAHEAVEYYTPDTWLLHEQAAGMGGTDRIVTLQPGQRYDIGWNKAVSGPSLRFPGPFPALPFAARAGNVMAFNLPLFSDSSGIPREVLNQFGETTGSISLYDNGNLVGTQPSPSQAGFRVPREAGNYRLSVDATLTADWWPLSTKVSATWGFRSGATDSVQALPLLTARFDPSVDIRDRAPGGGGFSFPAFVARQGDEHPVVASFTVDVSYDDGKTWQPATVTPTGDHFTVGVNHPATGFASLRATATDADGNSVEQTIIRAYAIGR
jgi:hypothetical protein